MKFATYEHFRETESLVRKVNKDKIAKWLLNVGYFPEENILPPSFTVSKEIKLQDTPYNININDLKKRQVAFVSFPKSTLTYRNFSVQHPWNYHDIIFYLHQNWDNILSHIFHSENKVAAYSFPIPVSKKDFEDLSPLRAGRMIYEWLEMAEEDLILDGQKFNILAKTDITNFYPSIYTHGIGWAIHGREEALEDKEFRLFGNKIDRLFQYSNDGRTNGIPIGSTLSDLIAETILADIDRKFSQESKHIEYAAVRFKDDYRILCNSKENAKKLLDILSHQLSQYNLSLNESKTSFLNLPDGLYREHNRAYFPHVLRRKKYISFRKFEHTLLIALDIHRKHPGTSIIEKFIAELFDKRHNLKISYSSQNRGKEIRKTISLLFLLKRESTKILCHVLSVIERLYIENKRNDQGLKDFLRETIKDELDRASKMSSVFEIVWLVFFCRYISLGFQNEDFDSIIKNEKIKENVFYKSIVTSKQELFKDTDFKLFTKPRACRDKTLAERFAIFKR
jgi:retron-type reverse transcriptase